MDYSELVQFRAAALPVRLSHAMGLGEEQQLVANWLISKEMAERLQYIVFPHLRFDHTFDTRGVLVVGSPGSGKSHLLTVLSAVAEHAETAKRLGNETVAEAAGSIAGKFKVIRGELGASRTSFRNFVCARLETGLAEMGIKFRFPPPGSEETYHSSFERMMAVFHARFPEHGLLLLVDELPVGLREPRVRTNARDVSFLRELGEACGRLKLRFVGALCKRPPPDAEGVVTPVLPAHDPFVQVPIPGNDLRHLVRERLLKKTAHQEALIREHLTPWAKFYGNMTERMDEFVALFPVHPDYFEVLGQVPLLCPYDLLRAISHQVQELLRTSLPRNGPGLIAFDAYWEVLCANPTLRSVPEVEAVIEYNRLLKGKVETFFERPELRHLALRIVHGLSIHRLTTGDVYSPHGPRPAELRDTLCLQLAGVEEMGGKPADDLLLHIVGVLDVVVHKVVRTQFLSYNPETDQYFLHLRKFKRFVKPELALHWVNAIPFILLLVTGGTMLTTRFCSLDPPQINLIVALHKICAAAWLCFLPLTVLLRPKVHWQHIGPMLKWGAQDLVWMVQSLRSLINRKAVVPPAARFNTGQKMNACLVMLYFLGFTVTGAAMIWKAAILFPWYVHTCLFLVALGSVSGHLYLSLFNPGTRIALAGIFHGWSPMRYVEHHHSLSLPRSLRSHLAHAHISAKTIVHEFLPYRTRMILLLLLALVGGVAAFRFYKPKVSNIHTVFAHSFSQSIKPRELSPKHRLSEADKSCTQCHTYAGGIPDSNCERCHAEIERRRASRIGYHGKLEGSCISCHKEHPAHSQAIVQLDRDKFDHNLAAFKREGGHARLACDECHKKKRTRDMPGSYYVGLKSDSCTDCHRDPHAGRLTSACEKCHSAEGWTGPALKLVHDRDSSYPLLGKHKDLACAKCHKPASPRASLASATFKGLPVKCAGCHNDPHRSQFAAACDSCHSPAGWDRHYLAFDHNRDSRYPLAEKHVSVACEECHVPAKPGEHLGLATFRGLKTDCADCHQDPHLAQFGRACTRCHETPVPWSLARLRFDHKRDTKYTLLGKHAAVDCIKCHKPRAPAKLLASAQFTGLGTSCENCHQVKHPPNYGPACTSCHTLAGWPKRNPGFGHIFDQQIAGENLGGKHLTTNCRACHNGTMIGPLDQVHKIEYECLTCHQKDEPHKAVLGAQCSKCHNMDGWKGPDLRFDHSRMARFALDPDHQKVPCAKCHENGHYKPLEFKCVSCHTNIFSGIKY